MSLLQIRYSDGRTTEIAIDKPELILGRDASCDVPLEDPLTSRKHFRLYIDSRGEYWVQDLNSKNGISVNDRLVTVAKLRHGDRIGVGTCGMVFCHAPSSEVVWNDDEQTTMHGGTNVWTPTQRLELSQRRLETLYELNERLTGRLDRDNLLGELLDICSEQLRFERAGIGIWAGEPRRLEWIRTKNLRAGNGGEFSISRSVVDRALNDRERILILDTADGKVDPTVSMISANIRSAMCVPMEFHQEVRGVIYGDRTSSAGNYTKEDTDFFAAIGRLGAMGLANVQLVEEIKQRQFVESQLQLARQIQAGLLPEKPIETGGLNIEAINDPGHRVSGDYYDYFVRDDGLVAILIADVAGKGLPASLLMANLQAAVQVLLAKETNLAAAVQTLNALVIKNISESRFITAIFGLLDPKTRKLTLVNCGHLPPYLIRRGESVELFTLSEGFPLGIMDDCKFTPDVIELSDKPSTLLLYTDGVGDAEDESGEMYGEERLHAAVKASAAQPPHELVTRLRRSIKQFTRNHPPTDDITILALRME